MKSHNTVSTLTFVVLLCIGLVLVYATHSMLTSGADIALYPGVTFVACVLSSSIKTADQRANADSFAKSTRF